ncbi:MAG TPA: glycosyltransferase family 39 protein, partial [Blastocatellia bacterium]
LADRGFDLALALCLTSLAFCVGRAVGAQLKLDFASHAEEISFSIMLGSGGIGLGLLLMGLAGMLSPLPVTFYLVLLLVISRKGAVRLYGVTSEALRGVRASRRQQVVAGLFVALVSVLVLRAATPPHIADEAIYHLAVSKSFVAHGRVYPLYDNAAGNMPFLLQMIYTVCLMAKSDIAAKLFSLLLAVATAFAIYGFCARFLSPRVAALAMFGFFGCGMVVEVAVTTRIDVALACCLFLATSAMMIYFETGHRGWLHASAILAGFSLSLKYSAAIYVFIIGAMFLVETFRTKRSSLTAAAQQISIYTAIALAIASPWLIKNLVWFHNPVYPFIKGELAEYEPDRLRYFTAEDDHKVEAHFAQARKEIPDLVEVQEAKLVESASKRETRHPLRFWEYYTRPVTYTTPAEPFHDANTLFLVAPLLLIFKPRRWLVWLGIFSVTCFVLTVNLWWVARFLLPIYPALTILAVYAITELADRLRPRVRLAAALPALAVLVTVGSATFVCAEQVYVDRGLEFVTGSISRDSFMFASTHYYPSINFINRALPEDASLLLIGAQMNYDVERRHAGDTSWDTTVWRRLLIRNGSYEAILQDLKQQGVTHILFTPKLYMYAAQIGQLGSADFRSREGAGPDYLPQLRYWSTFEF